MISDLIDECSAELRYLTELLEVREKIRAMRVLYPTQKKDQARITHSDMTLLMAREIELKQFLEDA